MSPSRKQDWTEARRRQKAKQAEAEAERSTVRAQFLTPLEHELGSMIAPQTTSARQTTNAGEALIARLEPESLPEAMIARQATSAQPAFIAQEAPVASKLVVEARAGYTRVPNTVLDGILPTLDPYQQAVYVRLFRLTHGFQRDTCKISFETLAERSGMSKRQVIRAIEKLEAVGLVERTSGLRGKKSERGNVYRVPGPPVAEGAMSAQQATSARQAMSAHEAHMKDLKENHEKAPGTDVPAPGSVYDVRKKAAQIYEARHREPEFNATALRAAVVAELVDTGLVVDEPTIDEAIKGMV
jgi:DNA-binding Lrp family transcriptional regulator